MTYSIVNTERLTGMIYFRAELENVTSLRLGNGEGEDADLVILKDKNGSPYISGTSLGGVLKKYLEDTYRLKNEELKQQMTWFFGADDTTSQAHVIWNDAIMREPANVKIRLRDGVSIDQRKGVAKRRMKFDYETLDPGCKFDFSGAVQIREAFDPAVFSEMISLLLRDLGSADNGILLGGMTNNGFGEIRLRNIEIRHFDFKADSSRKTAIQYFKYLKDEKEPVFSRFEMTDPPRFFDKIEKNDLRISLSLHNIYALLMGANPGKDDKGDKISFKIGDSHYLVGSGFKGALRHRAFRILHTLKSVPEANIPLLIDETFGAGREDGMYDREKRGKIRFREPALSGAKPQFQPRIKTNPLLRSVVGGALFNAEFAKQGSVETTFLIRNYSKWQAWLFLAVLKDLIHEDLAVGGNKGIGYGRFTGEIIKINDTDAKDWIKEHLHGKLTDYLNVNPV